MFIGSLIVWRIAVCSLGNLKTAACVRSVHFQIYRTIGEIVLFMCSRYAALRQYPEHPVKFLCVLF